MACGADEYQQNKEGKCRYCYQKKPPLKKLLCHILNQHKNKLSQEIQEINGHFRAKIKLPLLEGSVEPGTIICKTRWNNGQNVDYVSAQKICTLPKFTQYIMNINKGQCPQINEQNVNEALSRLSSTIEIEYPLIPGKVSNKQRLLQKSSGNKRIQNVSVERNVSRNIISPEPPSPNVSLISGNTSVLEEGLLNRIGIDTPLQRQQHQVPIGFYDDLEAMNDGPSNVNGNDDESRFIHLSVSSSDDDDVDNSNVSINGHPVLPAADVPSTTNNTDTLDIVAQLMGLNLGSRNDNNVSPETSNSVPAAETNRSKLDECRLASSNTSTESSTPTSISESSNVTTLERNENPEDHFNAFPYEAIPACISDYVNKNQNISQPKLQSQESSDVPLTELPAPSSSQDSKVEQNPANQNQPLQKSQTSISSSQKSILDQISRLKKDCRRPMIIDPENLTPTVKCQSLHMYILKDGGSPLGWFFYSPKLDTVQTIFSNGFCITQDGIVNKRVSNVANVKVQDEQGLCNYISWWNREMSTFGFLFCSYFMSTDNQKQEVPIRSFMSNVACFPFSPTFKEINLSFNTHAISRPFFMTETNIQIKSYLMIFVFRYGDAFPVHKLEIQPAAFATNLNEIFGTLRVYDLFRSKLFDLKFYRNCCDSLFLYEFPADVDVNSELSVRFSIDYEKFGDVSDGLVLFGEIVNSLSVNR